MLPLNIGVIIPVSNQTAFQARRAIFSVLNQSMPPNCLVIIDNSPNNQLSEVLGGIENKNLSILVIKELPNIGPSAARNIGINALVSQDYIALLDADDEWFEDKLKLQIEFMDSQRLDASSTSFLFGDSVFVKMPLKVPKDFNKEINSRCHLGFGSTLIIKGDALKKLGGFNESLRRFEDWEFGIRMGKMGTKFGFIDVCLSIVNRIPNSNWNNSSEALTKLPKLISFDTVTFKRRFYGGVFFERSVIEFRKGSFIRSMLFGSASILLSFSQLTYFTLFIKKKITFYCLGNRAKL